MNSREEWRDIPGYEGLYMVSSLGRVKSLPKYNYKTSRIMSQNKNYRSGRMSVILCKGPKDHSRISVHRLVALAFIDNPQGYTEINHKDENPQNNSVENLEWCSRKYNMNYGTTPLRTNEKNKKPVTATNEKGDVISFNSVHAAQRIGFDGSGIYQAIKKNRKYKGFLWRYNNDD